MLKLAAACAALFSCLAFVPESASAATGQPQFTVRVLSVNGSGCPLGSTAVIRASDTEFSVAYSEFIASAGGGASPLDFRKNCQLNISVGIPSGWTFGIAEVDYHGYAHLGSSARGTLSASYYYAGLSQTYRQQHAIYGPADFDYTFADQAAVLAFAPCHFSATLNVNTEARAYVGSDESYLNVLTVDMSSNYRLAFRRC